MSASVLYNCFTRVTGVSGVTSVTNYTTSGFDYDSDESVKTLTPNYWQLKAEGNPLPVQPYLRTIVKGSVNMLCSSTLRQIRKTTGRVENSYVSSHTYSTSSGNHALFISGYSSQIEQAKNDAKEYLADHIANVMVDLPTELVEAEKTAHMLSKYVKAGVTLAREFRFRSTYLRRKLLKLLRSKSTKPEVIAEIKQLANTLNGLYLEYNYGWKPLVYSIDGVAKILEDQLVSHKHRKKISGHAKFSDDSMGNIFDVIIPNGNGLRVQLRVVTSINYDVWVGGLLLEEGPSSVVQELGLEASNIPSSLWELCYMSFIVDYFSNLGGVIGNLRGLLGRLNPGSCYMSEKTVVTTQLFFVKAYVNGGNSLYSWNTTGSGHSPHAVTTTIFKRTPMDIAQLGVSFNLRRPTGLQIFKTLSVAIQTAGLFRKK